MRNFNLNLLKNSKFQTVYLKSFSTIRFLRHRNQNNMNVDYTNVKILLEDEENNLDKFHTQNKEDSKSNSNLTCDLNRDKKWTKEYTYPLDFNILKYRLKGNW
jgi:hypothetical protein